MRSTDVDGLILAAGLSSRAKANKMLFELEGKFLIQHTIAGMRPFVKQIYIVTGRYDQELRQALKDEKDIKYIYNPDFMQGMYTSILCGLRNTSNDILLLPGDVSHVKPSTYEAILNCEGELICPAYNGQTGHPLFISKNLRQDILNHPNYTRLREYRDAHGYTKLDVDDIFITLDVDDEHDLDLLKNEIERN